MAGRPLLVVAVLALLCDGFNGTLSRSHRDLTSPDTRCALRLDRLAELGADWGFKHDVELVRLLSRRHLDDQVVYCIGLTLQRLATASPGVRMQLSTTGLPRVAVPQLLTANLRVRAVLLRLLEQCFGSPHMG